MSRPYLLLLRPGAKMGADTAGQGGLSRTQVDGGLP